MQAESKKTGWGRGSGGGGGDGLSRGSFSGDEEAIEQPTPLGSDGGGGGAGTTGESAKGGCGGARDGA